MQRPACHHIEAVHTGSQPVHQASAADACLHRAGAPAPAASCACAAAAASQPLSHLRHPGPQHDVRQPPDGVLDGQQAVQQQRVVPILLRALDAAKRQGAAAETELAALKDDFIASLRHSKQQGGVYASSGSSRGLKEASTAPGAAPGRIKAFRPPGQAPPPKQALPAPPPKPHRASAASSGAARGGERSSGGGSRGAIGPAFLQGHAPQAERQERLQVLQQDNAEMRAHLEALYAHCRHLQRQLDAPPARRAPDPASPQRPRQRAPTAGPDAAGDGRGSPGASGRAHSPGRATVVVASPRAGGGPASLAVAVFEPPPEDPGELRLALYRLQRQNLKLTSKLDRAREEAGERGAEARRWLEVVEQQTGAIAELRVEVEGGRRRQARLEEAAAAAQGEAAAARQDAEALLTQLQAAEAAAAAAEGEAAGLRCQLAASDAQLSRAQRQVECLKEEAGGTASRLAATDLVRREAERDRDGLEIQVQRLRATLAEAQAGSGAAEEELAGQLALAQQEVSVERQRGAALAARLQLAESTARESERLLTQQLRGVQGERDACLAAATRADALLVKLGQHAVATRGADLF